MKVFELNECRVCINPNEIQYITRNKKSAIIKTALINSGWYWGVEHYTSTGGFSFPVMGVWESFKTENDAIEYVKNFLERKLNDEEVIKDDQLTFF